MSTQTFFVMPAAVHDQLVSAAFRHRGYTAEEANYAAKFSNSASTHGIRTHNAIKALQLDEHLGSKAGGCKPGAVIEKLPSKFKAVQRWNGNKKLGMAVAFEAMDACMKMADEFGSGTVVVDNAFHYLWGGGYVIDAADKGYIAYTNCTAGSLAEVVPFLKAEISGRWEPIRTPGDSRRAMPSVLTSASTGRPASWRWGACSSSSAKGKPCRRVLPSTKTGS